MLADYDLAYQHSADPVLLKAADAVADATAALMGDKAPQGAVVSIWSAVS